MKILMFELQEVTEADKRPGSFSAGCKKIPKLKTRGHNSIRGFCFFRIPAHNRLN